jgi:hypothetical protein
MEAAELGLTAVRGVHLAASLSAFGVVLFWSAVAPPVLQMADGATRARIEDRFRRMFRASLAAVRPGWRWSCKPGLRMPRQSKESMVRYC